jgi:hypothetical protein
MNEERKGKEICWLTKLLFLFAMYSADDLILEENEDVLLALKRLPPKEAYDRVYRLRRAIQCSVTHKLLPKDQWTKPEEVRIHISCHLFKALKAWIAESIREGRGKLHTEYLPCQFHHHGKESVC